MSEKPDPDRADRPIIAPPPDIDPGDIVDIFEGVRKAKPDRDGDAIESRRARDGDD